MGVYRVLKPGGLMLSYSGSLYLPQIFEKLGKHLQYFWTFAVQHTGQHGTVFPVNVHQLWKPILGFYKPPFNKHWKCFPDMISKGQDKSHHKWGQPVGEAQYFIEHLCTKSGVLVDPMMGGATSIIAGMSLGMKSIGIEIDTEVFRKAKDRIDDFDNIQNAA